MKIPARRLRKADRIAQLGVLPDMDRQRLPLFGVVVSVEEIRTWDAGEDALLVTLSSGRVGGLHRVFIRPDQLVDRIALSELPPRRWRPELDRR